MKDEVHWNVGFEFPFSALTLLTVQQELRKSVISLKKTAVVTV